MTEPLRSDCTGCGTSNWMCLSLKQKACCALCFEQDTHPIIQHLSEDPQVAIDSAMAHIESLGDEIRKLALAHESWVKATQIPSVRVETVADLSGRYIGKEIEVDGSRAYLTRLEFSRDDDSELVAILGAGGSPDDQFCVLYACPLSTPCRVLDD